MRYYLIGLVLFISGKMFSQIDQLAPQPGRIYEIECIEGDTLFNDPDCYDCFPDTEEIFYGFQILDPFGRRSLVRHPYKVILLGNNYVDVTFNRDSNIVINRSLTSFPTNVALKSFLDGCPEDPNEDIGNVVIDTFRLSGSNLEISLNSEDSVHIVDLSPLCDLCVNSAIFSIWREYDVGVSGNEVVIQSNGGNLPEGVNVSVYVEGIKMREGGDYNLENDSTIRFTYDLEEEDVVVWFIEDDNGLGIQREYVLNQSGNVVDLQLDLPDSLNNVGVYVEGIKMIRGEDFDTLGGDLIFTYDLEEEDVEVYSFVGGSAQVFYKEIKLNQNGSVVSVEENDGVLPSINKAIKVFVEGLYMVEGSGGDYEKGSGGDVDFRYNLSGEDVMVWFILGSNDNGVLGDFRN